MFFFMSQLIQNVMAGGSMLGGMPGGMGMGQYGAPGGFGGAPAGLWGRWLHLLLRWLHTGDSEHG